MHLVASTTVEDIAETSSKLLNDTAALSVELRDLMLTDKELVRVQDVLEEIACHVRRTAEELGDACENIRVANYGWSA